MSEEEFGDEDNYIESLKVVVDMARSNVALSGVPLALLLSQMRVLLANENFWISAIMTFGVFSLFFATVLSWFGAQFAQSLLALDIYNKGNRVPAKGRHYLNFVKGLSPNGELIYTEETYVEFLRKTIWPTYYMLAAGYVFLLILLILVIWS